MAGQGWRMLVNVSVGRVHLTFKLWRIKSVAMATGAYSRPSSVKKFQLVKWKALKSH